MTGSTITTSKILRFVLAGRFAHFAQASSQRTVFSYPLPPRTVLLGLAGAVLGLPKDTAPVVLEPAHIAVGGLVPPSHWHKVTLRNTAPDVLPLTVNRSSFKPTTTEKKQEHKLVLQEWLMDPRYTIWMTLPDPYQDELAQRLMSRSWHFTPYLGITEMLADIQDATILSLEHLPSGRHSIQSIVRQSQGMVDESQVLQSGYALRIQTMPRTVTDDRRFTHDRYVLEANGRPINVDTAHAYQAGQDRVMFL